jgi:hypothetical protein
LVFVFNYPYEAMLLIMDYSINSYFLILTS